MTDTEAIGTSGVGFKACRAEAFGEGGRRIRGHAQIPAAGVGRVPRAAVHELDAATLVEAGLQTRLAHS